MKKYVTVQIFTACAEAGSPGWLGFCRSLGIRSILYRLNVYVEGPETAVID